MTKAEFKAIRRAYKPAARALLDQATRRALDEFVLSDETLALYEAYAVTLANFAQIMGCKRSIAADMLNLREEG